MPFSAAFALSLRTDAASCAAKHFMAFDWIRERMVGIDVKETIPTIRPTGSRGAMRRAQACATT
ncbi:hypothetical protein WL93_16670 [Burkholderia diffusa]|uniref:hypothetical protein n=1 Tax=Burkholderia diffusa TaxID=488732 RepID=UPI00075E99E9|nr:hypothetical protein [Burkholderia diffusa]KWF87111.1 hypothetical protein WL93_16670 [Burkholderia diffusa]